MPYSLRLTTSSSTRRYSGTRLNARRRSSGRRVRNTEQSIGTSSHLCGLTPIESATLPACEERPELRADRSGPCVCGVDVEPDPLRGAPLRERGDRVDRGRRGRADGRDERARVGEVDELRAHRERVVPGNGPELELEQPGRLRGGRMRVLGAHDDAPAWRGGAGRGERRHEPGRRGVLEMAVQPRREAEQVGEPGQRDLLELLERRRGTPEDPDLVQPRGEQLGEDRRAPSRCSGKYAK